MLATKITPLLWIAVVLLFYGVVSRAMSLLYEGWRQRSLRAFLSLALILITTGIILRLPLTAPVSYLLALLIAEAGLLTHERVLVLPSLTWKEKKAYRETRRQTLLHFVLATGALLFAVPFIWLVTTSFKEDEDIFRYPPLWIPRRQVQVEIGGKEYGLARVRGTSLMVAQREERDGKWICQVVEPKERRGERLLLPRERLEKIKKFGLRWENYAEALTFLPEETLYGLMYLINTLLVTFLNIIGVIFSSSLVAFAFARLRWPGRDILFVVMLSTMMLPSAVTLIPVFLIFRALNWVDTLRPLWIGSFFAVPFNVFLLRQFFLTIPTELEDAAKIDGCSYLRIYWSIMMPLIKPALAALTIFAFMGSWNNFLGPLIYISSPEKMTLAYALRLFQSAHGSEYGMLMAASTLVMLPVLLVFFFTQRYFIQGVTLTGLKG